MSLSSDSEETRVFMSVYLRVGDHTHLGYILEQSKPSLRGMGSGLGSGGCRVNFLSFSSTCAARELFPWAVSKRLLLETELRGSSSRDPQRATGKIKG
jgi:hypothetical protein